MKKCLVLILGLAAFLSGCGGNSNTPPPPPVTLTISPASASVSTSATLQFTATVANTSNTAVTWQVNGTTGGNSAVGTISSSGLYTAPASISSPVVQPGGLVESVTVTAVSQADTSASASSTVTITAAPSNFSVSPSSATVLAAATQQFTVKVTGSGPTPAVTWQVNTTTGGNTTVGTISTGGLYTAPAIPPSGQKVTVTAVSQADSSMSASAAVTVAPSVATLNGQYAFSFSGQNSLGLLTAAGSFQADGKGNIANGIEDINGGGGVFTSVSFTGTYTVGPDGRGSLSLALASGLGTQTFDLVLTSNAHARLIRFDTFATGTGNMDLQGASAFSNAALKGNFIVGLDGIDSTGLPLSAIGLLPLDGAGNVPSGLLDTNDDGTVATGDAVSGTYSVASNGRGIMTFSDSANTFDFAFYVVSAQKICLVSLDTAPAWSGSASAQQGSGFSSASLHGNVVFAAGGNDSAGNSIDDAGVFLASAGGLASDGVGDENDAGTVTSGYPFTGTYSIDSTGHGSLTLSSAALGNIDFSFYLVSSSQAFLLGTDSSVVRSGSLLAQTQAPFTNASLSGAFGFGVDGTSGGVAVDKLGQFTTGGSASASGNEDINGNGALTLSLPLTAAYSVGLDGRGSFNVTAGGATRSLELYLVSRDQVFLIGLDTDQVVLGQAERQFK